MAPRPGGLLRSKPMTMSSRISWLSSEKLVCRHLWRHDDKKATLFCTGRAPSQQFNLDLGCILEFTYTFEKLREDLRVASRTLRLAGAGSIETGEFLSGTPVWWQECHRHRLMLAHANGRHAHQWLLSNILVFTQFTQTYAIYANYAIFTKRANHATYANYAIFTKRANHAIYANLRILRKLAWTAWIAQIAQFSVICVNTEILDMYATSTPSSLSN